MPKEVEKRCGTCIYFRKEQVPVSMTVEHPVSGWCEFADMCSLPGWARHKVTACEYTDCAAWMPRVDKQEADHDG